MTFKTYLGVFVSAALTCLWAAATEYQEAPMLAEQVARGELPRVDERLPENPLVVTPVNEIGVYGGEWRRLAMGMRDLLLISRMGYDPLVRWDRDTATKVTPGLAESWEVLDGGRTFVFHLRRGLKWSDGHPLTSEDFLFYYEDFLLNKHLNPVFPSWLAINGKPATLSAPDAETLVYAFDEPYGIFLEMVCFRGVFMVHPKHYMKQFHSRYTDEKELTRKAEAQGLNNWWRLYGQRANFDDNPDLPTCCPWKLKVGPPAARMIAERNPYYWKVDTAGNQLPYIDRVVFTDVQNNEMVTFKAMAGEVDFQARRIDAAALPLFLANAEKGNYRVMRDANPGPVICNINQCSKDEQLRPILQDRRFRIALSVAINREELIDLFYTGLAVPSRGVASPYDPYYLPEYEEKYLQYDPAMANRLLDEVGLPRGRDGIRRLPDGKRFRQMLNIYPTEVGTSNDLWQVVTDYWREVGLDFVIKLDAPYLSVMQIQNGNSDFWAYNTSGLHWTLDPMWYVPWQSTSYFAPLFGRYVASNGKDKMGVRPPEEYQRLVDWYRALIGSVDPAERLEYGHKILGQWAEECYTIGICRNELLTIVSNDFHNVPERIIHDYRVLTPGYIGLEQFYIDRGTPGR